MKNVGTGTKAVILLIFAYTTTAATFAQPIMGAIARAFPGQEALVPYVMTLSALPFIPATILAGIWAKYTNKKTIINIGSVMFIIGSLGCGMSDNLPFILVMRTLAGFGAGLIFPLAPAMIAQIFGKSETPKYVGFGYAVGAIVSTAAGAICGVLGAINWHYSFYFAGIFIPLLIFQLVTLPSVPPEKTDKSMHAAEFTAEGIEKPRLNMFAWSFVIFNFLWMCIAMTFMTVSSSFIEAQGLGTAVEAGVAGSLTTGSAMIFNALFVYFYKYLKRQTLPVGLALLALTFLLYSLSPNLTVFYTGCLFQGLSMALVLCGTSSMAAQCVPRAVQTQAISNVSTAQYLGFFCSTYVIMLFTSLSHGSIKGMFMYCSITMAVVAVIALIFNIATGASYKKASDNALEDERLSNKLAEAAH